jgi:CDP-diglyceride synthetase
VPRPRVRHDLYGCGNLPRRTGGSTWEFVIGGILYFILLVTLGIITIRKGHWVMFIIGIFIPLFWIIGALMPPREPA